MSFDTEVAGCSVATGFVVDKEQGLILTNRPPPHVPILLSSPDPISPAQAVADPDWLPPLWRWAQGTWCTRAP